MPKGHSVAPDLPLASDVQEPIVEWEPPAGMGETIAKPATILSDDLFASDLARFQKNLVGEIHALMTRQHEALISELTSQIKVSLEPCQSGHHSNGKSPMASQSPVAPSAVSVEQRSSTPA